MQDLNIEVRDMIDGLFIESANLQKKGDNDLAVKLAEQAWYKLPQPKFDWDVSLSFTLALAETYRDAKLFDKALSIMQILFESGTLLIMRMALDLCWQLFITIKEILLKQQNGLLLLTKYLKVVVLEKSRKSIFSFINPSNFE